MVDRKRTRIAATCLLWTSMVCLPACSQVPAPTTDPRADLDGNGTINVWDIFVLHFAWFQLPSDTPTPSPTGPTRTFTITNTPTITPTPTDSPTSTPTPSHTPTISFNGRVFGTVMADGQPQVVNLLIDPAGAFPPQNTLSLGGSYEFTGLPIGVLAVLSTTGNIGFTEFTTQVIIEENTEQNVVLLSNTPTATPTVTDTSTPTPTITQTRTITNTPIHTNSPTVTQTFTPTVTLTPTQMDTPTLTRTSTTTRTPTQTGTPTVTKTPAPTLVNLAGTSWRGQAYIGGGLFFFTMTTENFPPNVSIVYSNVAETYVNAPILLGTSFHFPQTNASSANGTFFELEGVFVSGDLIVGNMQGDIRFRPIQQAVQEGTFQMRRD